MKEELKNEEKVAEQKKLPWIYQDDSDNKKSYKRKFEDYRVDMDLLANKNRAKTPVLDVVPAKVRTVKPWVSPNGQKSHNSFRS